MFRFSAAMLAFWFTFAGGLQAQQVVVVELFTSQGCSACPPADKLLKQMAGRDDVIPLALHVDYWDYIGWKDEFAQPAFTARQKAYAQASGRRMIYTPQMVINGQQDVVGNRPKDVEALIAQHAKQAMQVELGVTRIGGQVRIKARALAAIPSSDVILVRVQEEAVMDITHGENAGHRLRYSNIVREWVPVARWSGKGTFESTFDIEGQHKVVVLIQARNHGPVLAGARLR
ncbi:MAG: DUF1223 domain-containing protein [Rhodobacteraceae bacterium]|nr:DUF1223 domain-containing protein [Paracoccaceae bacterium]